MLRIITAATAVVLATTAFAQSDPSTGTLFERLDSDGDGMLSQAEAQANPRVSELYESLDTSNTLEEHARNSQPGISRDQFEAGMAAAETSGAVGPAAAGGETYKVYPDGSREQVEGTGVGKSGANRD